MGFKSAQIAAPTKASKSPSPEVTIQRFTTKPGRSQRNALLERDIKSLFLNTLRDLNFLTRALGSFGLRRRDLADLDSGLGEVKCIKKKPG